MSAQCLQGGQRLGADGFVRVAAELDQRGYGDVAAGVQIVHVDLLVHAALIGMEVVLHRHGAEIRRRAKDGKHAADRENRTDMPELRHKALDRDRDEDEQQKEHKHRGGEPQEGQPVGAHIQEHFCDGGSDQKD